MKWLLTIAYDGRAYCGWDPPGGHGGVRERLLAAVCNLQLPYQELVAASRTDAGVHASALSAHLDLEYQPANLSPGRFVLAMNSLLPEDIRVMSARAVAETFHARFDAIGKAYHYHIWNHAAMHPLLRHRAWHVPAPLDLPAMNCAAQQWIGNHDFRTFTSRRAGDLGDTRRTLRRLELCQDGASIHVHIEGSGFLYKMCRALVGTLVEVGRGRRPAAGASSLLSGGPRRLAGPNAPAHGLTLCAVRYPDDCLDPPPTEFTTPRQPQPHHPTDA